MEQAVEAALNTSGRAVLFAGATVVIALLGMFALGVSLLNGAAVAAAIGCGARARRVAHPSARAASA